MEPLTSPAASSLAQNGSNSLGAVVSAVIPCLDEEAAIGAVVRDVLAQGPAEVIVVDGGSRDGTAERAREAGARVVVEPRRGYGRAIMSGIAAARLDATILLFLDGDGSDRPRSFPTWSALSSGTKQILCTARGSKATASQAACRRSSGSQGRSPGS